MSSFIPVVVALVGDVPAPAPVAVAVVEACGGREEVADAWTCLVSAAFLGAFGVDIQLPIVIGLKAGRKMKERRIQMGGANEKRCREETGVDKGWTEAVAGIRI